MLRLAKKKFRSIREPSKIAKAMDRPNGLKWQFGSSCPIGVYDAASARVGNSFYLLGGYGGLDVVSDRVYTYDIVCDEWVGSILQPSEMANSHTAVATDGARYIYVAGGQCGPQCRPPNPRVYSLDTKSKDWSRLPDLPAARYAGTMQLWRGRLHFVGGADEDRWTPCADHWSIAVSAGRATEDAWQVETSIPVPGMHRGSVLLNDNLYVIGGQQGDFTAIKGDPDYRCTKKTQEKYLSECFRLDDPRGNWNSILDLPIAASHVDFSVVCHDEKIFVVGGQVFKHPEKFYLRLTDAIQVYDPSSAKWSIFGTLPYALKLPCATVRDGKLICVGGQRAYVGLDRPGPVSAETLKLNFDKKASPVFVLQSPNSIEGKSILAVSHNFSRTGGPLLLLETLQMLEAAGAQVRVVDASRKNQRSDLASEFEVPVVPYESSFDLATKADIVIANSLHQHTKAWVQTCSETDPEVYARLLWWIHEIDVQRFRHQSELVEKATAVVFDSTASQASWAKAIDLPLNSRTIYPAYSERFLSNMSLGKACREETRRHLGIKENEFLVCSVGTIGARKGQSLLCRTLAKMALRRDMPVKLLLVGFDGNHKALKFYVSHYLRDQHVMSMRRLITTTADYARYFPASDAIVVNSQGLSQGSGENFGRVTTEAMAYGLPVLGTDAGGTREIIHNKETGLLYPTGAKGQIVLAQLIERLVKDRDYARRLGQSGQSYALETYNPGPFMSKFEEVISSI